MASEQVPELRGIVRDACQALARLDAVRLEELAVACCRLQLPERSGQRLEWSRQAAPEMAVFARVLAATRENLNVMRRLQALREGRLEYRAEGPYGHD